MNKFLHYFCLSVSMSVILSSCVNKDYNLTGDIDYTISNEMTLVGPIGHSNIKLFEALPDSFRSFKFSYDENEVYFTKQDTEHLGNDIIGHIKMTPTHEPFEKWVEAKVDATDPYLAVADSVFVFDFDGINTDMNERLDSIMYKDGTSLRMFIYDSDVDITAGSSIEISFDKDIISLNPYTYPDNKVLLYIRSKEGPLNIDMGRAIAKFNGGKRLKIRVCAKLRSTSKVREGSSITFAVDFRELQPRITYGYLGPDRFLSETTKTIDFGYAKDLQKGDDFFLPFYDPQITLRAINSIGVPAKYNLQYVKAFNTETGEEVYAEFNGSPSTTFALNYPKPTVLAGKNRSQINGMQMSEIQQETAFLCDRNYGHTDRLFKIKGNKLSYKYTIRTKEDVGDDLSFFFDNSNIDVVMDVKLPCRFEGNTSDWMKNFYIDRFDTVKIDFAGIKPSEKFACSDETVARVRLTHINHLAVDGDGEYWLVDENFKEILPQKHGKLSINAAPSDASGVVTAPAAESSVYIKFNYAEFKELTEKGKGLVIKYKIINKDLKDVWFKSNDWLDLTLDVWAQGTVSYDFNKQKGGAE